MSAADIHPAAVLDRLSPKFLRERTAFKELLASLLPEYDGKFVAVHDGRMVDSGDNQIEVVHRCHEWFGYIPVDVGKVSSVPTPPARMPNPRALGR